MLGTLCGVILSLTVIVFNINYFITCSKDLILETNIYTQRGPKFYYVIPLNKLNHPNVYVIINKNDPKDMVLVEQSINGSTNSMSRLHSGDSGFGSE